MSDRARLHPSAPDEPDELGELSEDAIAGPFRIVQRVRGHRYSLDDVITAWEAATTQPTALNCLELGTGIGSVLLMLAYKLASAQFVAVEAQRNSFRLATENVARNGLAERVRLVHADFRDVAFSDDARFDLITGTPPYVPPGQATPSADAQRAFARQEMRGGVEAYVSVAGPLLAAHGRLVVCADARSPERVEKSAENVGLRIVRRRDVLPRLAKKSALFSVFTLAHRAVAEAATPERLVWAARDAAGARTQDYLAIRAFFDLPQAEGEKASP
jgi:tRNA1(Val) A37 N6-methylase TrmN6